jgi:ribose 5-phosphate isomerase B
MKIGITNDHRGVNRKKEIIRYLRSKGHEIFDFGSNSSESVDYPIYAFDIGKRISNNEIELGILLCGTGVGMCIAANKVNGVRCANLNNIKEAKLAHEHNNANAIALSADMSLIRIKDILDAFLKAKFSSEERHIRRVNLIDSYTNDPIIKNNDSFMDKDMINVENNIKESSENQEQENVN